MSTPLDLISLPQPHFIPGYTGYCPQYKFRSGNTYGSCTHKVLVDPAINHSEYLILSDRSTDEYQVYRPCRRDIDLVKSRTMHGGEVYQHPMIPGYEGFVPRMNNQFGQSFSVSATEALSEFERQQMNNKRALQYMKILGAAQDNTWDPMSFHDKTLTKTDYKLPLSIVRPDRVAVIRDRKVIETAIEPPIQSRSPYFMDNSNPEKRIKQGTSTYIPFGYGKFGVTNDSMTNSALCDFTSNYRKRLSTEWAPVSVSRPDPPLRIKPAEIYHKHIGQMPHYAGHLPGAIFRCGKTFGEDSRDGKRWLRILRSSDPRLFARSTGLKIRRRMFNKNEYAACYRQRRGTEWMPSTTQNHPRPYEITSPTIYHSHVGLVPNYTGHVPGAKFRFGRTYGQDTLDAKRWLRGSQRQK